jgi:translation initiation factor IF-2
MSKVRINDLAKELEVKSRAILDLLPELGVSAGKTHSSSLELDEAEKVRAHFVREARHTTHAGATSTRHGAEAIVPKIDLSHISKPGDVMKASWPRRRKRKKRHATRECRRSRRRQRLPRPPRQPRNRPPRLRLPRSPPQQPRRPGRNHARSFRSRAPRPRSLLLRRQLPPLRRVLQPARLSPKLPQGLWQRARLWLLRRPLLELP